MIFVALTVSDEASRLTSDSPVQFTWNEDLLGGTDQGGPDPDDLEFASLLSDDLQTPRHGGRTVPLRFLER